MNDQTLTNRGRPNTERVGKPNTLHSPSETEVSEPLRRETRGTVFEHVTHDIERSDPGYRNASWLLHAEHPRSPACLPRPFRR